VDLGHHHYHTPREDGMDRDRLRGNDIRAKDTELVSDVGLDLGWFRTLGYALELGTDRLNASSLGVGDGGGVTPVGVDASKDITIRSSDAIHDNVTLIGSRTVAAGTVQLAKVINSEIRDRESAGTVVLKNLVIGAEGSTALDVGGG
jgi:hypothetical protein